MNIVSVVKKAALPVVKIWDKHDSTILTATTIVATGAAVVFAIKDGPKCQKILREKNKDN